MVDLTKPLFAFYPLAKWTLNGDVYEGLAWLSDDIQKPTEAELITLWESIQAQEAQIEQAQITAKESALAKLAALGLTEDEVKALIS